MKDVKIMIEREISQAFQRRAINRSKNMEPINFLETQARTNHQFLKLRDPPTLISHLVLFNSLLLSED